MRSLQHCSALTLMVLFAFVSTFVFLPVDALAGWHDRSDELPGMSDSEFMTKAVLIGGIALIVIIIAKSSKNKKNKETEAAPEKGAKSDSTSVSIITPETLALLSPPAFASFDPPKVLPYVAFSTIAQNRSLGSRHAAFSVGIAFNF